MLAIVLQELLATSTDRVDVVDLRTKLTGHSAWAHSTQGLQLLPTPDGSQLLALGHSEVGWKLQSLSLDEVADPPLFRELKAPQPLPLLGHLPEVRACHSTGVPVGAAGLQLMSWEQMLA